MPRIIEPKEGNAGPRRILHQRLRHAALLRICDGVQVAAVGRHVVIRRGERPVGCARREASAPQHLEGRRRTVLQKMTIDVEKDLAVRSLHDPVSRPDLLEQRPRSVVVGHRLSRLVWPAASVCA
jgi:hypothetical protein